MEEAIKLIEKVIIELEQEYQNVQGMILSEGDLKCHLFRKLYDLYDEDLKTMDAGITTSPVHSEISYYNSKDVLYFRPDIAIINPLSLSILHSIKYDITKTGVKFQKTPTKEFQFGGNSIIFELKFCRNKKGINPKNINSYIKDIEKIQAIQKLNSERSNGINNVFGFFIVFNKTNKYSSDFQKLFELQTKNLKIIYKTGNVVFPK
jgi:hypothetical protein